MDTSVLIKSSHDGTSFEFSDYTGGYFQATVHGPHFQGRGRVYAYKPSHLAAFFRDLATHWQGWSGQKKWVSLEEELSFAATSDSTGHTCLVVRLRSGSYPFDWSLNAVLLIEAGQLELIAKKMEELFIADSMANA
jgi:hypothetical protein